MSELAAAPSGGTGAHLGPVGSLLERFRRTSGVPAAASEDVEAELLPVFAALVAIEEEAAALVAEAQREAERRIDVAARDAARIGEAAVRRAALERARSEAEAQAHAAAEAGAVEAAAHTEAEALLKHGRERLGPLAREIVAEILPEQP